MGVRQALSSMAALEAWFLSKLGEHTLGLQGHRGSWQGSAGSGSALFPVCPEPAECLTSSSRAAQGFLGVVSPHPSQRTGCCSRGPNLASDTCPASVETQRPL